MDPLEFSMLEEPNEGEEEEEEEEEEKEKKIIKKNKQKVQDAEVQVELGSFLGLASLP